MAIQTLGDKVIEAGLCAPRPLIPAHVQKTTLHLIEHYPAHEPRETDPHYRYFHEARARLEKLGKLTCWIGNADCAGQIELHHSLVEFALANGVDVAKFAETYPEFGVTTDEEFLVFIEGEGNLTPICKLHHTGLLGIHCLPYPLWQPQKYWRSGLAVPAQCEPCGTPE